MFTAAPRIASAGAATILPRRILWCLQRGCELALFQPLKVGNMDCTFCLDCVHACPHDNVGVLSRVPAAELMTDPMRSGIGLFSRRKDIAALVMVFTFGALLNAFGMVSPVYAVENWLGGLLHVKAEAPALGAIFAFFLVVEPVVLLGAGGVAHKSVERQPSGDRPAGGEIFLCVGAARFWHVAGALWISFFQRAVYFDSRDAKCCSRVWAGRFSARRHGD